MSNKWQLLYKLMIKLRSAHGVNGASEKNPANGKVEYHYTERLSDGSTASDGFWDESQYTEQARTGQAVENVSASNTISNAFRRSHVKLSNYINQTKQRQRQASGGGGGRK